MDRSGVVTVSLAHQVVDERSCAFVIDDPAPVGEVVAEEVQVAGCAVDFRNCEAGQVGNFRCVHVKNIPRCIYSCQYTSAVQAKGTTPRVKPYYQDELVTLYLGDCLTLAHLWTSADVLITDPPYGVGGALTTTTPVQEWDKTLTVRDAALAAFLAGGARGDELTRPYAIFASPRRLDAAVNYREVPLIWDKGEGVGMGDTKFPWRPSYELIYVSGPGWSGRRSSAILRVPLASNAATKAGHPTPKPVALMRMLVEKAPAGIIADPFAGTGSTLMAAKELGRHAIGVEMDPAYARLAADRLAQDTLILPTALAAERPSQDLLDLDGL